jgi:hypothetical protein
MHKAGNLAQLRKVDWQGRDGCAKGETLADTLAEQSKPCAHLRCHRVIHRRLPPLLDVYFALKPVFERA